MISMEMGYEYFVDFSCFDFAFLKLYLGSFTTVKHPGPIIYNKGSQNTITNIYNPSSKTKEVKGI
jgi:hypothetical protein